MIFSRTYGEGIPLIIVHGLFGMSDNWNTLGKKFAENFNVHIVDLRNHGRSFHSDDFSYDLMAEDIEKYIEHFGLNKPILLGHSLGGKVAMNLCFRNSSKYSKLVVADIAPRVYSIDYHKNILQILNSISLKEFSSRSQIDLALSSEIKEFSVRQFLMKNLYRDQNKEFIWRFNIKTLKEKISNISGAEFMQQNIEIPALFLKGELSNYINQEDELLISKYFVNSKIKSILNSGHWVHAEQPEQFYKSVFEFIV